MLLIIDGFVYSFGCSPLSFFFFSLLFLIIFFFIFYFNKFISLFFFLPFLLSHVADRVLVLWLDVRPVPLRWES